MAISQVITFKGSPDQLVWKYPEENITCTSQLIVDEPYEALLMVNGQAADLFGAGTRTLSLPNIPILNKITTIPTGGVNPFPCKVFYVNKTHQLDMLWGTQGSPIPVEDPEYHIFLHVMLRGNIALSVDDTRKFLMKLVGLRSNFRPEDVVSKFKGLISSHVKDLISKLMINHGVGFFTMQAQLMEVSEAVKQRLDTIFEDYGLAIQFFNIESIDVPEKDYDVVKAAKARQASRTIEGINIHQEHTYDILKRFASNEGNMGQIGAMGTQIGVGSALGSLMANTVGGAVGNAVKEPLAAAAQTPAAPGAVCVCGAPLDPNAKFCMACGTPVPKPQGGFCANCGAALAPGAKFCMECGTKVAQSNTCPGCGAELTPGAKFCMECGHKL